MFSETAYSQVGPHIAPALNLLTAEYFNMFDEACQKQTAKTLAQILRLQSENY
jgi:hypothetical protein